MVDPTPEQERVDNSARLAGDHDQRTVYIWTFSYLETFAAAVMMAYEQTGKTIVQWVCGLEMNPQSGSEMERWDHFHMAVEADNKVRWKEISEYLWEHYKIYASVATSTARKSYRAAFSYLFAPTAKKNKGAY